MTRPCVLLLGNGPYTNRGCEAILRGTMRILRAAFGEDICAVAASFGDPATLARQNATETDPQVHHLALTPRRGSLAWIRKQTARVFGGAPAGYAALLGRTLREATAVLEVGGDNYSLDYGFPQRFLDMDEAAHQQGRPVVLWGASVGPFNTDRARASRILMHLRSVEGIFARESATIDYLRAHGIVANVCPVADPAFALAPQEPAPAAIGCSLPAGAIGVNLSPLLARYITGGDQAAWLGHGIALVEALRRATGRPILLVPHVTQPGNDDHLLLAAIAERVSPDVRRAVHCVGRSLSAAETKWVIGHCAAFAGARTHATIAALSSEVPTLVLAYSTKGIGLTRDLLGDETFCLRPEEITPARVVERMQTLLAREAALRAHLDATIPQVIASAFTAGMRLRELLELGVGPIPAPR